MYYWFAREAPYLYLYGDMAWYTYHQVSEKLDKSFGLARDTARYAVPIRASQIVPHFTAASPTAWAHPFSSLTPEHRVSHLHLPSLASRRRHGQGARIATLHGAFAARM